MALDTDSRPCEARLVQSARNGPLWSTPLRVSPRDHHYTVRYGTVCRTLLYSRQQNKKRVCEGGGNHVAMTPPDIPNALVIHAFHKVKESNRPLRDAWAFIGVKWCLSSPSWKEKKSAPYPPAPLHSHLAVNYEPIRRTRSRTRRPVPSQPGWNAGRGPESSLIALRC